MKNLLWVLLFLFAQNIYSKGSSPPPNPLKFEVGTIYGTYSYLPAAPKGYDWKLWFSDEFNGSSLDMTKWQHSCKDCVRRLGYWREDGTDVDGKGLLRVKSFKDGKKMISGAIETVPAIKFKYGFYIAKVKTQNNQGMWSAMWLWPHSATAKGAVEIDVFEYGFIPFLTQNALHWYQDGHRQTIRPYPHDMPEEWHTFAVKYTPDDITFYRDGKEKWKTKSEPTDSPLMIMFSTEIGELAWGRQDLAKFPDAWYVDWVRFYTITKKK